MEHAALLTALGIPSGLIAARHLTPCAEARELAVAETGDDGKEHLMIPIAAEAWKRMKSAAAGDGSLMMHVQELETIRRHRLNILIVVMNDGAYGSELHKLRAEGMPEDGSVFGYCDFAAIARGFGLPGKTVKNLDDLPKLAAEFAANGGAAVWDFHVSARVLSPTMRRAHPQSAKERAAER
ncbi:MAG: thiamine pyrophosphate-dependent enzyme [Betaproteobacteria bacterium]|nr:thiamine pyrophosphate-dependent enzyme [Betaproteobacteria bacterium]